jgi:hypothetical protein
MPEGKWRYTSVVGATSGRKRQQSRLGQQRRVTSAVEVERRSLAPGPGYLQLRHHQLGIPWYISSILPVCGTILLT